MSSFLTLRLHYNYFNKLTKHDVTQNIISMKNYQVWSLKWVVRWQTLWSNCGLNKAPRQNSDIPLQCPHCDGPILPPEHRELNFNRRILHVAYLLIIHYCRTGRYKMAPWVEYSIILQPMSLISVGLSK